jgi:hypothetical protein
MSFDILTPVKSSFFFLNYLGLISFNIGFALYQLFPVSLFELRVWKVNSTLSPILLIEN